MNKQITPDERAPVLYLRFFKDDKTAAKLPGAPFFAFTTEEEYLAQLLDRIGPCIAAGVQVEKLPQIGVRRVYLQHDTWQKDIRELVASSRLVVIRAGRT